LLTNPYEILTQGFLAQKEAWYWFSVLWPHPFSEKGLKRLKLGVFAYLDGEHSLFVKFWKGFLNCVPQKNPYLEYDYGFDVAFTVLEIKGGKKGWT
jgi:hypothetical protein